MPSSPHLAFGRGQELHLLDKAWKDAESKLLVFRAWGGVGKSTLVSYWEREMAEDNYSGAEAVFAWSFYSQGTGERVTSADQFVNAALEFFGYDGPSLTSPWDKGDRLADLIQKQRTLLLLDGIEPLQSPHDFNRGEVQDPALILLCYKNPEPQKGQLRSCCRIWRAIVARSVAIEIGLCRSARMGSATRAEAARRPGDG